MRANEVVGSVATRLRRRGAALAVAPVLALGLVTSCDVPPGGCSVGIVGDSLTQGTGPHLAGPLAERGCTLTFISAAKSRFTEDGVQTVENIARLGFLPEVLVVALGTNDSADPVAFSSRIDRVMQAVGGRQVIWVNIHRPATEASLNAALARADARYDNLTVYDWNSFVDGHPQVLARDDIHLTPGGYVLRAALISQQVTPPAPPAPPAPPEPAPAPAPEPAPAPAPVP